MNDVCAYVHEAVKFDFQQQSHHQCGLVKAWNKAHLILLNAPLKRLEIRLSNCNIFTHSLFY
jgi:hypothetical protein